MRTLATQLRLRRLLRSHSEYMSRLALEPGNSELARFASRRLRDMLGEVRTAWANDSAGGDERDLEALRRHVSRTLATAEASLAELQRPNTDWDWLAAQFRESAAPLLFFLRGLEEVPDILVHEWLSPAPLQRTA